MKVIGFAGSSSRNSINKKLVEYTLSLFEHVETDILDLNDFEVEIYSVDKENEQGIPEKIKAFSAKVDAASLLVISLAEHNGSYTAAFKNIYDWLSRIPNRKVFNNKPILLMATSPGGRGGASVLATATDRFARDGSEIWETFSLPNFQESFDREGNPIIDLRLKLKRKINHIIYNKLKIVDDNYFTCGIDRSRNPCGDANEY